MYAEERQQRIISLLKELGKVSVQELSNRFSVTTPTIRADLKSLHSRGLITKTHGGALYKEPQSHSHQAFIRPGDEHRKSIIGLASSKLIHSGQTIFIDSGTTTYQLARQLPSLNDITVITNDLKVALSLENSPLVNTIVLGGSLNKGKHCTYHIGMEAMIHKLSIDIAFMSASGFKAETGAFSSDMNLAESKKIVVNQAEQVVVLCDYSKLDKASLACYISSEKIDTLVTDKMPLNRKIYEDANIELVVGLGNPDFSAKL
ncbi:DeoR/GlpR family DNA-binding transcription regulator [Photobacterium sp. DNB23_23_1]